MRFIHTADWHLGRLMYGVRLTNDQAYMLDRLIELVKDAKPNALVIAGDVYDRAIPPPDAVELLDDVLSRIVLDLHVPVILIAGNHDGPMRLEFGARLLESRGLHVVGTIREQPVPVTVSDRFGRVHFLALPYAEPALVREKIGCEDVRDHEQAVQVLVNRARECIPPNERSVVVTHAFVSGGEAAESERPLSVGGAYQVDKSLFEGFQYVALGHLHRAQHVGRPHIRYSGSLLKYSFSEANHEKVVNLVEMDAQGECTIEGIPLTPRRNVRCIEGYLKDILTGPEQGGSREDYVQITLLDRGALLDVMNKLRDVYPNILHVERPAFGPAVQGASRNNDPRKFGDEDLFAAFFSEVTGELLNPDEAAVYKEAVEELMRSEREAADS